MAVFLQLPGDQWANVQQKQELSSGFQTWRIQLNWRLHFASFKFS